jgi:type I restriction enzyme S subunit
MPRVHTLGDACSEIVDCAHKTAPIDQDGQYFAVGTPAMRGNTIDYSQARRISKDTFDLWTTRLRPEFGDLLLAREAPVGPVVRVPEAENVAPGQRTVLLRPRPGVVESRFLYYYLTSPSTQSALQVKASGSTVPHLNVADVRLLPTPGFPDYSEQQAITEVLGALDDKIAANNRIISTTEQLMVALAGTSVASTSVGDLAVHEKASASPSAFDPTVAHFSLPAFDATAVPEVTERESIKSNKFVVSHPVVLVSKLNPRIPRIWNVSILPNAMAVASTEFVALAPQEVATSEIWAALSQPAIMADLASNVAGTSGSHQRVKPAEIMALSVPDPRQLSTAVRAQITCLGELTHSCRMECLRLETTRDELLPLLMSGKVRVREAEKAVEGVV